MTMAAAMESRTADAPTRSRASRIASVEIITDLDHAEGIWRGLEDPSQLSTPYQRFDLLGPWQRSVGERTGCRPFIVIAYDSERRPVLLLPLACEQKFGVGVASFMGGKHTSFNMGLWNTEFAAQATAADLDALLSGLRANAAVDVLALTQQPLRWNNVTNPFAMLPGQRSVNDCPLLLMTPGGPPATRISNSFRRRLRAKERKLESLPGYRYHLATTEADANRMLDWFFRIKPMRMSAQKLPNVFGEPALEHFIRSACLKPHGDGRIIEIHALECDEEVIAIFAGVADGRRFSAMFNTYTMSPNSRFSPGLVLIRNIIDCCAKRGYHAIDLGIGTDEYKRLFCKSDEQIFDCFIPLTFRGKVAATAMSALNRSKRLVKQDRMLFGLAQKLRRAFH